MKNLLDLVSKQVARPQRGIDELAASGPRGLLGRLFGRQQGQTPGQDPNSQDSGLAQPQSQAPEGAAQTPEHAQQAQPEAGGQEQGPPTQAQAQAASQETAALLQQGGMKGPDTQEAASQGLPSAETATDPQTKLGLTLAHLFPHGVPVAVYDNEIKDANDREFGRMAKAWAATENAVGSEGAIGPASIGTGVAIPIAKAGSIAAPIQALHSTLAQLAEKVAAFAPQAPRSQAIKIQRLGIFTHGYTTGMRSRGSQDEAGKGVRNNRENASAFIGQISSALTGDVRVALYACTTGRGKSEADSWTDTTLNDGGEDGYAAAIRDGLAEHGHEDGHVGAHTTVGHTTRNFALREFSVRDGAGAAGGSFAKRYIWDWTQGPQEVVAHLLSQGYQMTERQQTGVSAIVLPTIKRDFYRQYNQAMSRQKTSDGRDLQELAMLEPLTVQAIVKPIWDSYWQTLRQTLAQTVVTRQRLTRAAEVASPSTTSAPSPG